MKIYKTVRGLNNFLEKQRKNKKKIGFSPTMGALHKGHLSLVEASMRDNDINVVSIFVNPTQFNNKKDLEKYPRVFEEDAKKLKDLGLEVLFLPNVKQIYPNGSDYTLDINLHGLENVMEGEFRPGHFEGMMQVVKRLLEIVKPHNLYMGQKDFQQFTIVKHMMDHFKIKTDLHVVPIMREETGLAMSSRNRRLSKKDRKEASLIYTCLLQSKEWYKSKSPEQISRWAKRKLKAKGYKPEYFDFVNGDNLKEINSFRRHKYVVACTAVWVSGVRLIDNIIIKSPK